ncbi:MAG: hypothetical protein ACYTG0_24590, partial [Planctomycetota bacterium]|jgi:hypothetical protein
VLERLGDVEPVAVDGGPVDHPLAGLTQVFRIPWFCGEWVDTVLLVKYPFAVSPDIDWSEVALVQVRPVAGGLEIGFREDTALFAMECVPKLVEVLKTLPDGTVLEMVTAGFPGSGSEEKVRSGNQRYRGTLRGGTWQIEATWPAVGQKSLAGALALTRELEEQTTLLAADEEEAAAVLEAAERHPVFHHAGELPSRDGLRLWADGWLQRFLALLVFRRRFRDAWPVEPGEEQDKSDFEEAVELDRQINAPHDGEVLLEGEASRFFPADIKRLPTFDEEALDEADEAMGRLGLSPLGNLVCSEARQLVVRGYGAPDSNAYGIHMQTTEADRENEFYTRFEDGSSLTTTTNVMGESYPEQGVFSRIHEECTIAQLHEKHLRGIGRFRERKGTVPCRIESTLIGLARTIDEFLQRRQEALEIEEEEEEDRDDEG